MLPPPSRRPPPNLIPLSCCSLQVQRSAWLFFLVSEWNPLTVSPLVGCSSLPDSEQLTYTEGCCKTKVDRSKCSHERNETLADPLSKQSTLPVYVLIREATFSNCRGHTATTSSEFLMLPRRCSLRAVGSLESQTKPNLCC